MSDSRPIAFFDSGLGGISVLRETVRLLPEENYLYYGDSLHAPYGVKSEAQIQALSLAAAEHLVSAGAKAIVVACNTATSAAIGLLRQVYPDIPVIGTEPALKPAVEKYPGGRILVMATPMTIKQEKFQALKHQFDDRAQIIGLPCEGLMEFVERGELRGSAVEAYLTEKLAPYLREPVDGIVLGCTRNINFFQVLTVFNGIFFQFFCTFSDFQNTQVRKISERIFFQDLHRFQSNFGNTCRDRVDS